MTSKPLHDRRRNRGKIEYWIAFLAGIALVATVLVVYSALNQLANAVDQTDAGSRLRQRDGSGRSDAAGGAGHEGDAAGGREAIGRHRVNLAHGGRTRKRGVAIAGRRRAWEA